MNTPAGHALGALGALGVLAALVGVVAGIIVAASQRVSSGRPSGAP